MTLKQLRFICPRAAMILIVVASVCLAAPGDLDMTFNGTGKVVMPLTPGIDIIEDIVVQPDGKIVAVGQIFSANGASAVLARFNPDGTLDLGFGHFGITMAQFGYQYVWAHSVALQSDGRIVVCGSGAFLGEDQTAIVARFQANGVRDMTFHNGGFREAFLGVPSIAQSVAVQADDKIVVGGTVSGKAFVLRYTRDGLPDRRFGYRGTVTISDLNQGFVVESVKIQPDQKIVALGNYGSGLQNALFVVRLQPHGKVDASFDFDGSQTISFGPGLNISFDCEIQADGKLVIGGHYAINESTGYLWAMARLNSNGAFDGSFDGDGKLTIQSGGVEGFAFDLAVQQDGKIVMGGGVRTMVPARFSNFLLMRRNSDGSPDVTFGLSGRVETAMSVSSNEIRALRIQSDGRILTAGYANGEDGNRDFALARYLGQ